MMTRFALIAASFVFGLSCCGAVAQQAQQARQADQQPSYKGKAMRDCHRQITAGGNYQALPVEQRRKAMAACLQAKKEDAFKHSERQ